MIIEQPPPLSKSHFVSDDMEAFFLFMTSAVWAISDSMATADWTSVSPGDREALLDLVEHLLHDWIKYMEMRLNSIDFSRPPEDLRRTIEIAVLKTRRFGHQSKGVAELWASARNQLELFGLSPVEDLMLSLDQDVSTLVQLLSWPAEQLEREVNRLPAIFRRPGDRLRSLRNELLDFCQ